MDHDQSVSVYLDLLVDTYQRNAARASAATRAVVRDVRSLATTNEKTARTLQPLGGSLLAAGVALGGLEVLATRTAMTFDKAMSGVAAATHAGAEEIQALRDAALQAGADTAFTADEAAQAVENLAKAGVSSADILGGGLTGALDLAAAGNLNVADAAEIAATSLTQFKLTGADMAHVADVLAAGAGKAQGEVYDMALAMQYAGVPASSLGASIDETAGTLALFAKNGIIGERAGTSFRSMLASLSAPSIQAQDEMDKLGLSVFDGQGKFIGLAGVAGELHDKLSGATDAVRSHALGVIFGNEALQAANVLVREGADGVDTWTRNVDDAGYAAETARLRLDNLAGDIEKLGGSLDTALIKGGSKATGVLRFMTQAATGAVNQFSAMPGPLQTGLVLLGGLSSTVLTLGGGFLFLLPRIDDTRDAFIALTKNAPRLAAGLSWASKAAGWGIAIGVLAEGVYSLAKAIDHAIVGASDMDELTKSLLQLAAGAGSFKAVEDAAVRSQGRLGEWFDDVDRWGASTRQGQVAVGNITESLEDVDKALSDIVASGSPDLARRALEGFAQGAGVAVDDLLPYLDDYDSALNTAASSSTIAADKSGDLEKSLVDQSSAVDQLNDRLDEYSDLLDGIFQQNFGVQAATDAVVSSVLDWSTSVRQAKDDGDAFSTSLSDMSEQGLANRGSLRGIVEDALAVADALNRAGMDPLPAMQQMRDSLLDTAEELGFDRTAVAGYIDVLLQIPTTVNTTISFDDAKAYDELESYLDRLSRIPTSIVTQVEVAEAHRFQNQLGISPGTAGGSVSFGIGDAIRSAGGGRSSTGSGGSRSGAGDDAASWMRAEQQHWRDLYDHARIGVDEYLGELARLQAGLRRDSAEWFAVEDERQRVRDEIAANVAAWNDAVARNQQDATDLWMATLRAQFEIGERSREQYVSDLRRYLDTLDRYSDEARRIRGEIAQIEDDEDRERERAEDERDRRRDEALSNLERMLDQEAGIRRRMADLSQQHTDRLLAIDEEYNDDLDDVLADRRDSLLHWTDATERFSVGWANSVRSLTGNLQQQAGAFTEWQRLLAEAKARGVSDAVIDLLGLGDGPAALAQLRMFSSASQLEINELNAAVADRVALAGDEVAQEQLDVTSRVGRMLVDLAEQHAAAVEAETEQFLADMRELRDELDQIGRDQGRAYGDAVAEGLRSSVAAVRAAAQELQDAMGGKPGAGSLSPSDMTKPAQPGAHLASGANLKALVAAPVLNQVVQVTAFLDIDGRTIPVNVTAVRSAVSDQRSEAKSAAAVAGKR